MTNLNNTVQLIGRLGMDPKVTTFDKGNKKVSFSLATSDFYTDADGKKVDNATWHNIVAWGKTGELAEKYLSKGNEVVIGGRISNRQWEDKEGNKHYITEIVANQLHFIGKKNS